MYNKPPIPCAPAVPPRYPSQPPRTSTDNTLVKIDPCTHVLYVPDPPHIDQELSDVSTNSVSNKAVTDALHSYQTTQQEHYKQMQVHISNYNNPHKLTGEILPSSASDPTPISTIIKGIQTTLTPLPETLSTLQQTVQTLGSEHDKHVQNKNNPHETTGANAKIASNNEQTIKDYIDNQTASTLAQAKEYTDNRTYTTAFVFGDLESFKSHVKLEKSGDAEKGFTSLVSITTEEGTVYPADKLPIGEINVYLRQTEVPDYWLSTKEVNYQTDDPLVFFLPLEGESKIDLSSYVQKTDYPTSTQAGVIKVSAEDGLLVQDGSLKVNPALPEEIASRSGMKVITASNLPISSVGDNIQLTDGKITVKDKGYDPLAYHWTYNPSQTLSISSMPNRHFETVISTDDDFYLNTPNGKEYANNNYKFFDFIKDNAIHGNVQSDITITADLSSLFTDGEEITVNPVAFILYPSIQNYANIPEHSNYTSGLYLYSTVLHFNKDYLAELAVYIDQDSTTATFSLDIISGEYAIENITDKMSTGLGSNYKYNKFTINEKDYTLTPEVITEKIITDLKTTQSNYSSLSSNYTSLDTRLTALEDKVSKIPEIANNIDVNLANIKWEG